MALDLQINARTVFSLFIAAACLVCFTFFYSLWQWHGDWKIANQSLPRAPAIINNNKISELIDTIPNTHLFGLSPEKEGNMPLSNLQLRVTGIVKAIGDKKNSNAAISIAGQPSKIYHIGDKLPYGVKIYDITEEAVILENNEQLEKLPLPRLKLQFKPNTIRSIPQ